MVIKAGINLDELVQNDRVHGRIYTDPHIFALEMERIFGRCWVYVAHESEVAQPGDYKATYIGLQPVIVTRDADAGEIHVLYNRCRHRAATVCQEERGTAHYFRCAYHGWTYNNRGELIGVPYRQGYGEDFTYAAYGLAKVPRVASYRGFIFASLSPDVPSLDDWLGNARPYIDIFAGQGPEGIEVACGVHKYGYDGNWKFHLENSCDNYHTDFVHQSTQDIRARRKLASTAQSLVRYNRSRESRVRALGNGHTVNERPGAGPYLPLDLSGSLPRYYQQLLEERLSPERAGEAISRGSGVSMTFSVFPNLTLIGFQIRVYRPIAPDSTEVSIYPTLLKGVPDEVNAIRLRIHEEFYGAAGFGGPDDVEMFARVQTGLKAKGNEWLIMSRGLDEEEVDERGVRSSEIKNETGIRGIYQQWKKLMAAD